MTKQVRIDLTLDNKEYGATYAFSKDLKYTKKQMILKALESLQRQIDRELTEENEDEGF